METGTEGTVIVTGGGTGIGAACARLLAADGATVVIAGRTAGRLEEAAAVIGAEAAQGGGSVHPVVADVTDEASVQRLVGAAVELGPPLAGVVANAGGGGALAAYHLQDTAEFVRVLHLNVLGTMLLAKHTVAHLAATGGGSFVAVSSIAGGLTHRFFGAYGVAKAGVEQLIRTAADEYGPARIRFNAVRPGFTATEIMAGIPRDSPVYESYLENTPLGGVAEPADVAEAVRFLIGRRSRWITGQVLAVDGGHSLRRGPDFSVFAVQDSLTQG